MKSKIIATGSYTPTTKVSNYDFETIFETSHDWIVKRTGIHTRFYENESNANMALHAARHALEGIDPTTIECIIVGTYTPDTLIPGVGGQVRLGLGLRKGIPAFDLNAACSGFLFALQTANAYIQAGIYQRILVIGSDYNSRFMNFKDRTTSILFGDGAGAVVLEACAKGGIIDTVLGGDNDDDHAIYLPNTAPQNNPFIPSRKDEDAYFTMKGADVFKFAVQTVHHVVTRLLENNHLTIADVDVIISHQANQRILDMAAKSLNARPEQFLSHVDGYGNTSSGSVPLLLDQANAQGYLKAGSKIILVAFGGGLSYGASLIEWT